MYLPSSQQLSVDEASAVVAYLVASAAEFRVFKECEIALLGLINNHSEVVEIGCDEDDESLASSVGSAANMAGVGDPVGGAGGHCIYRQGQATDKFTLILQVRSTLLPPSFAPRIAKSRRKPKEEAKW